MSLDTAGAGEAPPVTDAPPGASVMTVFAAMWAMAALFHCWVNAWSTETFSDPSLLGISHLVTEGVAVAVLLRPSAMRRLLVLAACELVTVWLEMPTVGNHWILAGLIDIALLVAAGSLVGQRAWAAGEALGPRFVPTARWCLLLFYAFAAFSKVNSSFLDPAASCGSFFYDETVRSLGLGGLAAGGHGFAAYAALWTTLVVELSVPVLLADRRFRHAGVVVGIVFHSLIALDRTHLFSDFTSALDALFVLFLPASFSVWALGQHARFGRWVRQQTADERAPTVARAAVAVVLVGVSLLLAMRASTPTVHLFKLGREAVWLAYGVSVIVLVVWYLRAVRPAPLRHPLRLARWWLVVVPVVVALNGFTPYLEVKTGFGWNMYANLRTAGGDSNHLIVWRTLPVTDQQQHLVRVLASNDPGLQVYADQGYELAWLQFREYLSRHPDVSVRYQRGFEVRDLARASDDPALVAPVPLWEEKFLLFRAVDERDPVRCQPGFLPAR
jgi:hypothetical protein